MKRPLEMQYFRPTFATPGRNVLAHLPVHGGFQRVLDREGAAFNKKVSLQRAQAHDPAEGLDELDIMAGVDIGVRDLDSGGLIELFLNFGLIEQRMVEPNRE